MFLLVVSSAVTLVKLKENHDMKALLVSLLLGCFALWSARLWLQ